MMQDVSCVMLDFEDPGLEDLAALTGMTPAEPTKPTKKLGYDGKVVVVRVRTEKRRGKDVTIIWGFNSHPKELHDILATCKKTLGTGGQVTDNAIELQGNHVERAKDIVRAAGFAVQK